MAIHRHPSSLPWTIFLGNSLVISKVLRIHIFSRDWCNMYICLGGAILYNKWEGKHEESYKKTLLHLKICCTTPIIIQPINSKLKVWKMYLLLSALIIIWFVNFALYKSVFYLFIYLNRLRKSLWLHWMEVPTRHRI